MLSKYTYTCTQKVASLQGTKIFGKSSLRFVPVLGWAWTFTESIFLKRAWETDKETISRDLKYIHDYPDGYWVTVISLHFICLCHHQQKQNVFM